MALDYYKLQPHRFDLVPSNRYETGRAGHRPRYIVRHHLMMVNATGEAVRNVWLGRVASAHYTIQGAAGRVGQVSQHVYDANTAWANANQLANRQSYTIEHSNNSGRLHGNDYHADSWNIADEVIVGGARWAAALLVHDKLGPPVYGKTIRDHSEFTATGCPVHLQGPRSGNAWGGRAGKHHYPWMEEAESFYRKLDQKLVKPDGTPIATYTGTPKEELTMAQIDELKQLIRDEAARNRKHTEDWIKGFIGPIGADTKDVREQLTGARDAVPGDLAASYPGWNLDHLVNAVEEKIRNGEGLQVTEMAALAAYQILNESDLKKEQ